MADGQDQDKGPPTATTSGKVLGPVVVVRGFPPIPKGWHVVDGVVVPPPE